MTLRARIERLTRQYGDTRPCAACGAAPTSPVEIVFEDDADGPYGGPDHCPGCGRVLRATFTIEARGVQEGWDDDA